MEILERSRNNDPYFANVIIHKSTQEMRVVMLSMGELDTTSKDSGLGFAMGIYAMYSLSNDDGNAEDEAGKKMIYI